MMIMLLMKTNAVSYSEQTVTVDYDYQVARLFEALTLNTFSQLLRLLLLCFTFSEKVRRYNMVDDKPGGNTATAKALSAGQEDIMRNKELLIKDVSEERRAHAYRARTSGPDLRTTLLLAKNRNFNNAGRTVKGGFNFGKVTYLRATKAKTISRVYIDGELAFSHTQ